MRYAFGVSTTQSSVEHTNYNKLKSFPILRSNLNSIIYFQFLFGTYDLKCISAYLASGIIINRPLLAKQLRDGAYIS